MSVNLLILINAIAYLLFSTGNYKNSRVENNLFKSQFAFHILIIDKYFEVIAGHQILQTYNEWYLIFIFTKIASTC